MIQTVTGLVHAGDLGFTLPHEHISASLWDYEAIVAVASAAEGYGALPLTDEELAGEVAAFQAVGGRTIVDVSLPAIGRDPERLLRVTQSTGIQVVMGCGWYRQPFYPPEDLVDRRSADQLADVLIDEIRNGVGQSQVRPGVIGEIGANNSWVTAQEERVHRAAARASLTTGLSITTHSNWSPVGDAQLRIFREEGVDPHRVIIGHCDSWPHLDYYRGLIDQGVYVQFDGLGQWVINKTNRYEDRIVDLIVALIYDGLAERLLLSSDCFAAPQFRAYGGNGWAYIGDSVIPTLSARGIDRDVVTTITERNPARVLSLAAER
jgi:predicted metal-dependent phosphotriesterase family hydrolase